MTEPKVTYFAISALSSRTMWLGFIGLMAGLLSLPEVLALIPLRYTPVILAVVGFLGMYLRTQTTRPVAAIMPGNTKAVQVDRIGPPEPPTVTD
jgi:xanthosine utilization system XapX-like protein